MPVNGNTVDIKAGHGMTHGAVAVHWCQQLPINYTIKLM